MGDPKQGLEYRLGCRSCFYTTVRPHSQIGSQHLATSRRLCKSERIGQVLTIWQSPLQPSRLGVIHAILITQCILSRRTFAYLVHTIQGLGIGLGLGRSLFLTKSFKKYHHCLYLVTLPTSSPSYLMKPQHQTEITCVAKLIAHYTVNLISLKLHWNSIG